MRYSAIVSIVAFGLASFSTAAPVDPTAQGTGEAGDSTGPLGGVTEGLPAQLPVDLTGPFSGLVPGGGEQKPGAAPGAEGVLGGLGGALSGGLPGGGPGNLGTATGAGGGEGPSKRDIAIPASEGGYVDKRTSDTPTVNMEGDSSVNKRALRA